MVRRGTTWVLTRAIVMAGLAWVYSGSSAAAEADCYTGCKGEWSGGECTELKCTTDKGDEGHTKCNLDHTSCNCPPQGDACKGAEA